MQEVKWKLQNLYIQSLHLVIENVLDYLMFSFIGNSTLRSLALHIGNAFRVTESEPI